MEEEVAEEFKSNNCVLFGMLFVNYIHKRSRLVPRRVRRPARRANYFDYADTVPSDTGCGDEVLKNIRHVFYFVLSFRDHSVRL